MLPGGRYRVGRLETDWAMFVSTNLKNNKLTPVAKKKIITEYKVSLRSQLGEETLDPKYV
jgi:hypothetical protein